MRMVWITMAAVLTAMVYAAASLALPQLLLFPHYEMVGQTPVYSAHPLPPAIRTIVGKADDRVRASDLFTADVRRRPIFLTDGGPRWRLLSLGAGDGFALTRPLGEAIVVNRSSIDTDRVFNGAPVGGERSLSGVIAHERTHVLIRQRFGPFADRIIPTWKVEGYCDHIAGGGSLTDAEADRLRGANPASRALFYYDARRRVGAVLAQNQGSSAALFARS